MSDQSTGLPQESNKFWIAMCLDVLDHHVVGAHIKPPAPEDKARHAMQPVVVWLWMLQQATHKDQKRLIAGREVFVRRGQFAASQSFISKFANWSRKATRVFIERLQKHGMIEVAASAPVSPLDRTRPEQGQGVSVITICNYGKYQRAKNAKGQAGAKQGPARGQRGARITTVDTDTEDRETGSQSIPRIQNSLDAHEEKISASPDVIDLGLQRVELSARAKVVIAELGGDLEGIQGRARAVQRSTRRMIGAPDVYCVSMAVRDADPAADQKSANRQAKRLLNGDMPAPVPEPSKRPAIPQEHINRMSAPPAARSALSKTGLLKGR